MPRQAERSDTSLPWFTAASRFLEGTAPIATAFSLIVDLMFVACTTVRDKDHLRKEHNLWHDLKPYSKAEIEFK